MVPGLDSMGQVVAEVGTSLPNQPFPYSPENACAAFHGSSWFLGNPLPVKSGEQMGARLLYKEG